MYEDTALTYKRWQEVGRQVAKGERATWVANDMGEDLPLFFFWQTYEPYTAPVPEWAVTEVVTTTKKKTKKGKKGKKK